MTITQILFSFKGRINRLKYWGYSALSWLIIIILSSISAIISDGNNGTSIINTIITSLGFIIFLWITFALTVKRLHDIDYSGWGIFFFLIPFYNFYFSIIFYFVKGTTGKNDYGPDPLGGPDADKDVNTKVNRNISGDTLEL